MKTESVAIGKYKGWLINYDKEKMQFFGKKGKQIITSSIGESGVRQQIDAIERRVLEDKEESLKKEAVTKLVGKGKAVEILVNAEDFMDFANRASQLTTEGKIWVDNNKLSWTEMDPANVAMVHFEIPCKCAKDNYVFGINVNTLNQVLKNAKKELGKNKLHLTFKKEPEKFLSLVITTGNLSLDVPLIEDLVIRPAKVPSLDKERVVAEMDAQDFYSRVTLLGNFGESIAFIAKDKKLTMKTVGDMGSCTKSNLPVKTMGKYKETKARFSIEYLSRRVLQGKVRLEIKTDYPITITDEKGNWIILAPRVDAAD